MRYYVQHGAGLGGLVTDAVRVDLGAHDIVFQDDSSLVLDSPGTPEQVARLRYVKNAFQVLASVPRGQLPGSVGQLVKTVRRRGLLAGRRGTPFRTMVNVDGTLVALPGQVRGQLESVIAEQTGGRLNLRGGGGVEFWVIGRRDLDVLMLCERLSGGRKAGPRGSLGADLAALLVSASRPTRDDVFLDPFAGSGAILLARLDLPLRTAIYSDLRLHDHRAELPRRLTASRQVDMLSEDALSLPSIVDGSITALVTDPPWGEFEQLDMPYPDFAKAMLNSFDRILHPRTGRAVVLLARRVADTVINLWDTESLRVWDTHDILVNGHPATVLVGGR